MSEWELEIEKAKRADTANTTYFIKKLRNTKKYQMAAASEQEEMKKVEKKRVRDLRYDYSSLYSRTNSKCRNTTGSSA